MKKLIKIVVFSVLVVLMGYVLGSMDQGSFDVAIWNREQARDVVKVIITVLTIATFFIIIGE